MFCPKCGTALSVHTNAPQRDMLYCAPGDMGLSPRVATVLLGRYAAESAPPSAQSPMPAFSRRLHGGLHWYCPGCGIRLNEHLECPRCTRHLRDLAYDLIELHPHRDPSGRWR